MFKLLLFILPIVTSLATNAQQYKSENRFQPHKKKPADLQNDVLKSLQNKIILDSSMMEKYIDVIIKKRKLTTPEQLKEHDKNIAKEAYDSVRSKFIAAATPAVIGGTSLTYFNQLHNVEKKEVLEFTDRYLNKKLSKEAAHLAVGAGKKTVLKKALFFTMVGAFVLEVEEWMLPGVDRYTRWAIALGLATFLTILYYIQKREPTKANP